MPGVTWRVVSSVRIVATLEIKMRVLKVQQTFVAYLVALVCALVLAACGGGSGGGGGGNGGKAASIKTGATLGVMLTDAPACGFDAVYVTVRQVRINRSEDAEEDEDDDGWTNVNIDPPRKINLLDLNNGVAAALGEGPIGPGTYEQFRLVLVHNDESGLANSVVLSGTSTELPLQTKKSGIKLVHEFTVGANERADVLLDFDACRSVVKHGHGHEHENEDGKGTYFLKPVIKITPFLVNSNTDNNTPTPTTNNNIQGVIALTLLGSNVAISAQRNGTILQSTAPNQYTGEFTLARLDSGDYDVVVTADGHATALVRGVPASSSTATIGINAQPFDLPRSTSHKISGTITLNPVSPGTVILVTAKQAIVSGSYVVIKSDSADLADANYTLTLPVAAPLVGDYGSGSLPIALVPVPAAAGLYLIEGSAPGYTAQSGIKDLSGADVTRSATLVP